MIIMMMMIILMMVMMVMILIIMMIIYPKAMLQHPTILYMCINIHLFYSVCRHVFYHEKDRSITDR